MASKKMKRAIMLGLAGAAMAKGMKEKGQMAKYLAEEGGDRAKMISKAKSGMSKSVMSKSIMPKKKPGGGSSLTGMGGNIFGLGDMDGAKMGKMIKAKTGVMARGCKLGKKKRTIIT